MLWLALATLILFDHAAGPKSPSMTSAMGPLTIQPAAPASPIRPRNTRLTTPTMRACTPVIQRVDGRLEERAVPVGDGRVRLYRLFNLMDEQGCPAPVIVRDVPEADRSIGRELN